MLLYKYGIDVSKWDTPLAWSVADLDFIYVKISEGTYQDPRFQQHWDGARGYTKRGAYHYFRPLVDPKKAAQETVKILGQDRGELPIALDVETTDGRFDTLARAKIWCAEFAQLTGQEPIIYSRVGFLQSIGASQKTFIFFGGYKHTWLINRVLWVARYPFDKMDDAIDREKRISKIWSGESSVSMPAVDSFPPFKTRIWQWTALGEPTQISGYYTGRDGKKEVDLNFADNEFINKTPPTDTPPPIENGNGENTMFKYSITPDKTAGNTIRSFHSVTLVDNKIGALPFGNLAYGDEVWGDGVNSYWLRVLEVNGVAVTRESWIASIHNGSKVATINMIDSTPPPPDPVPDGEDINVIVNRSAGITSVIVNNETFKRQ